MGSELIEAGELIFNPKGARLGVNDQIFEVLNKVEVANKRELLSNVILSGGNTKVRNYVDRLVNEITFRSPSTMKTKVIGSADRQYLPWVGGSVVSALNIFQSMWITLADYDESGPSIVHRKCL